MRLAKLVAAIIFLVVFLIGGPTAVPVGATGQSAEPAHQPPAHEIEDQADHAADATGSHQSGDAHGKTDAHATDQATGGGHGHGGPDLGRILPLWSCIPFACMLLSIALFPLLAPEFWHHNFGKVSAFWAASFGIPFLIVAGTLDALLPKMRKVGRYLNIATHGGGVLLIVMGFLMVTGLFDAVVFWFNSISTPAL